VNVLFSVFTLQAIAETEVGWGLECTLCT